MRPNLIDEVNRLFDELIHDPWRRSRTLRRPTALPSRVPDWVIEVPLRGFRRGAVSVTAESGRLLVRVSQSRARTSGWQGESVSTTTEEQFQQSFVLPEEAVIRAVETTFDDDVLRIRVVLQRR